MRLENLNRVLKIGDVVILRSGGPDMTIMFIKERKTAHTKIVECSWFDSNYDTKLHNKMFAPDTLKKVTVAPAD